MTRIRLGRVILRVGALGVEDRGAGNFVFRVRRTACKLFESRGDSDRASRNPGAAKSLPERNTSSTRLTPSKNSAQSSSDMSRMLVTILRTVDIRRALPAVFFAHDIVGVGALLIAAACPATKAPVSSPGPRRAIVAPV